MPRLLSALCITTAPWGRVPCAPSHYPAMFSAHSTMEQLGGLRGGCAPPSFTPSIPHSCPSGHSHCCPIRTLGGFFVTWCCDLALLSHTQTITILLNLGQVLGDCTQLDSHHRGLLPCTLFQVLTPKLAWVTPCWVPPGWLPLDWYHWDGYYKDGYWEGYKCSPKPLWAALPVFHHLQCNTISCWKLFSSPGISAVAAAEVHSRDPIRSSQNQAGETMLKMLFFFPK